MKQVYKNSVLISLGTKIAEAVFYFLTDILAANLLGDSLYGEWCYFYAIITMVFLFGGFGINSAACVKVARAQDNIQKQDDSIWIGFKLRIFISGIFGVLVCVLGMIFVNRFGYPEKYAELKGMFFGGAFLYIVYSVADFFKNIYIGIEKMNYVFVISLIEYAGYLLCGGGLLYISNSIYGLEIGYIISLFIAAVVGIMYMFKHINHKKRKRKDSSEEKKIKKEILGSAIPFLITSSGTLVFAEMDTFLLGILSTSVEVGNYSIAKNIISKATHVNYAICVATMPVFAYICSENFGERIKKFKKLLKENLAVASLIIIGVFILGPTVITILYGKEYVRGGTFIRILLIYFFMYAIHLFFSMYMDYQGKVKQRSVVFLSAIILNLLLDVLWIPKMGGTGAAVATSISMLPYDIYLIVASGRIMRKYQKES